MYLHFLFGCAFILTNAEYVTDFGHIVVVSPPFFGHLIPLLDLAKRLSEYHHVTFVLSSSKLGELKQRQLIPGNVDHQSRLQFIELFDQNEEDYEVNNRKFEREMTSVFI